MTNTIKRSHSLIETVAIMSLVGLVFAIIIFGASGELTNNIVGFRLTAFVVVALNSGFLIDESIENRDASSATVSTAVSLVVMLAMCKLF